MEKDYLKACLTKEMLIRYGVKVEEYPGLFELIVKRNEVEIFVLTYQ